MALSSRQLTKLVRRVVDEWDTQEYVFHIQVPAGGEAATPQHVEVLFSKLLRHQVGRDGVPFRREWLEWELLNHTRSREVAQHTLLTPEQYRAKLRESSAA